LYILAGVYLVVKIDLIIF